MHFICKVLISLIFDKSFTFLQYTFVKNSVASVLWLVLKYLQATLILQIGNATFVNNPKLKNLKLDSNKLSGSVTLTFSDDMTNVEEINFNGKWFIEIVLFLIFAKVSYNI